MVAADMQTRKIRVYEETKTSSFYDEGVIDLNSNGKRWEGGIMRNRPFGYGVLYNEEGQKVFEGYMVERKKAIFSETLYFSPFFLALSRGAGRMSEAYTWEASPVCTRWMAR